MILLQGVWFLLGMCLQCTASKSNFHGVVFRQRVVTPEISFGLHDANLVRSRNIMKQIFLQYGVMFGKRVVMPDISFCLHEANHVRSRDIMKHIILGKSTAYGEIQYGVMFGKSVVTPDISFCPHEVNHVRSRDIMKHIFLGRSTAYGEIQDDTFCKGVYLEVYALQLVFCSIYSNENEFSV